MAEGEDSVPRAGRKRSAEREPRFRLRSEERAEPGAQLPDPGQAKLLVTSSDDGTLAISVADGPNAGATLKILNPVRIFNSFDINDGKITALAQQFNIEDFALLRAVLALAACKSRASEDYAVSVGGSPEFGTTHEEHGLLCEIDELSNKLGRVLRVLESRATGQRQSAVSLLAYRLVDKRLLEALDRCGQRLSGIDVTECIRPAKRPLDGRRRRVVEVLAWSWPSLTGTKPSPWEGNFHKFVDQVCRLVKLTTGPGRTAIASWLKREPHEHEPQISRSTTVTNFGPDHRNSSFEREL